MTIRRNCKRRGCKNKILTLAIEHRDDYCSAECCRADHDVKFKTADHPHLAHRRASDLPKHQRKIVRGGAYT